MMHREVNLATRTRKTAKNTMATRARRRESTRPRTSLARCESGPAVDKDSESEQPVP